MTTDDRSIIGLAHWLRTPPGRYLLAWEQAQLDSHVADVFGFHALQLGLPELDALRANRMPHRWLGAESVVPDDPAPDTASPALEAVPGAPVADPVPPRVAAALHCDFDA